MDAVVRRASHADASDIARIYNASIRQGGASLDQEERTEEYFVSTMEDPEQDVLVAAINKEIAGWGRLFPWSTKKGYRLTAETSIYVQEQTRGHGVGSALKAELIAAARSRGIHNLIARVFSTNIGSIRVNDRFGYRRVGTQREVGLTEQGFIDIIIFELIL